MGSVAIKDGAERDLDARLIDQSSAGTPNKRGRSLGGRYLGAGEILRILRRRRWFIIGFVLMVTVLTIVFLSRTPSVYSATSTVLVLPADHSAQPVDPATAQSAAPTANEDSAIQTKVEVLDSPALLRRVAKSLRLDKDPEFAPAPGQTSFLGRLFKRVKPSNGAAISADERSAAIASSNDEAITTNLLDHVSVSRVARSNVIGITASSTDPRKAALIANRIVEVYVDSQRSEARGDRQRQLGDLIQQIAKARDNSQRLDAEAAAYRSAHGLLTSEPGSQAAVEAGQISGLLAQARSESAQQGRLSNPAQTRSGDISASSALLTDLQQQEAVLMRKQGELTSFYGAGYPEVQRNAAELASMRGRIAQERTRVLADLRVNASASQARASSLNGALSNVRSSSLANGETAVKLLSLEREASGASALYASLLSRYNNAISSAADNPGGIAFLARAMTPLTESYPLPRRVLTVAVIAGLALAMLLAIVIEIADSRLRTSDQVYELLQVPTLAMVPEVSAAGSEVHDVVTQRPRSHLAEAMRNLLIEIETRLPMRQSRVVVLTSALENEGKSTIANSLAAAAASVGRQVVCVDFDLRRPVLTATPAAGSAGIVAYLADRLSSDGLAVTTHDAPFPIIAAGEVPSDPGGLIASQRLPALIEHLRQRFALVIVNAPPILLVRDAKTLAAHADATLLVVRWGKTRPEVAVSATEMFGRPFDGVVLNRVDYRVHASRRYGDALQHIAVSNGYYIETQRARWWSTSGWSRRLLGLKHGLR